MTMTPKLNIAFGSLDKLGFVIPAKLPFGAGGIAVCKTKGGG